MLQKQTITIPLGLGVNTKTDEKLVAQGEFNLVCENASFTKVGSVKKRQGFGALTTNAYLKVSVAGTVAINYATTYLPTCLATLDKSTIVKNINGNYLYSHKDAFILGDNKIPEVKVSSSIIYSPRTTIDNTDLVYDSYENILSCAVREQVLLGQTNTDGSILLIYDIDKKTTVKTPRVSYSVGANLFGYARTSFTRIAGISYYYHTYSTWDLKLKIDVYNRYGQAFAGSPALINNVISDGPTTAQQGPIGVCRKTDDSLSFFIVPTTTPSTARFISMSGVTKTIDVTFAMTGTGWRSASAKYDTVTSKIYLCYVRDFGQVNQVILNENGTVFIVDIALAGATPLNTVAYDQDTVSRIFSNGNTSYSTYEGGILTRQNFSSSNVTDKLSIGSNTLTIVESDINFATYFALQYSTNSRAGELVISRLEPGTALNRSSPVGQISRLAKISNTMAVAALPRLASLNGDYNTYSLQFVFFEISQDKASNSRSIIGKNIHFQGGFLSEFDGEKIFENGFHLPVSAFSADTTVAGSLSGIYSYRATLSYIDKNGQLTRSAPSEIYTTSNLASKRVRFLIPTMPFGIKAGRCKLELWRTLTGGSTFYFLREVEADMYANGFITGGVIEDNILDVVISDNAILYTTGDVLGNDPAPSCKLTAQGANRLFLAGLEDDNEIAYSKKKLFGECVNFSDFFRIRIDTSQYNISGGVTAIGFMDDKLVIFKKNSIFYVSGDGPLETGQSDTFTVPELISSDTGCIDPRSVVLCPIGLMFKGEKGIYLLGRGLDTKYIGSGVEQFNNYSVISSVHLSKKNEVVFTLKDSGVINKYMLVFDYFTQQWSVVTNILALDSDVLDGDHIVLRQSNNTPTVQNVNTFLDDGSVYSVKIKTPWIKVSGVQDFSRIWSVEIIGKYKSAHALTVNIRYDYDESYIETYSVLPVLSDAQYQYRIHLKKQKCEAVQFEIYDSAQVGESMELTALTLEVGARYGSMKLPAARKY